MPVSHDFGQKDSMKAATAPTPPDGDLRSTAPPNNVKCGDVSHITMPGPAEYAFNPDGCDFPSMSSNGLINGCQWLVSSIVNTE